jgi:mannose-6-phosphate isomerase-like protein (cupin superfamily)
MSANDEAFNLTALAYRLRSERPEHVVPVLEHGSFSATILRPLPGEPFEEGPALTDTIYVVITGFGCLGGGYAGDVDATAGDVLFVPAGIERRFTKCSHQFQIWRLMLRPLST